ncbi:MAG: Ig-like domain-containing domain [Chitinophagaceae bacterium]
MKKNLVTTAVSVILFILFISQITIQTSCANIIPPSGGPRDSLPPNLIDIRPADSTKNFATNKIIMSFDEYVEIQDVQKNLIVSPMPKVTPNVERKLNVITVKIRDTLEPNTTYTLDFGNSIKDLNEGNILKNFSYLFSTGGYFDSLELRGQVLLAKDATVDTTITVLLHRNTNDSAIAKEKPRYIAKVDKSGRFVFRHLAPGTYALYAMKDDGGTFRFSGRDQIFAFADKPVLAGDTTFYTLYAYPDNEGAANAPPPKKPQPTKEKRIIIKDNLDNKTQDLLKNFVFTVETPFKTFDSTKINFYSDSTYTPIKAGYTLTADTTGKQFTLKYAWKENTPYRLIFDKDFALDTLGNKLLLPDTISFVSKKSTDYGSLRLKLLHLDLSVNPVLLLLKNNNVVDSVVMTSNEYFKQVYSPGDYDLRLLYDNNKNGKWDPGQFFGQRKQPELIKPFGQKIVVKPNWDNDFERDVNVAPVTDAGHGSQGKPAGAGTTPSNQPAGIRRN